jgi:hypothetical protein
LGRSTRVDPALPLKVTLVWRDPAANLTASVHRVNDLNLRVISPTGVPHYGNDGLLEGLPTGPGPADERNTVENVFIDQPQPGMWTAEVTVLYLNADGRPETPCPPPPEPCTFDVDFALVVSGIVPIASIDPGPPDPARFCTIGEFLEAYLSGDADTDGSGSTSSADWFKFLDQLFAGTACLRRAGAR